MVLGTDQRNNGVAVREREDGGFFADEEFFNDHSCTGRTEGAVEADLHSIQSFLFACRHDHAFPCRKTIRLDHNAATGCVFFFDVCNGIFPVIKTAVSGGGDPVLHHERLGKIFAAFQTGAVFGGTEDRNAFRTDRIRHAEAEGDFRTDHHETDVLFRRKVRDRVDFFHLDGDQFRDLADPRVAGCAVEFSGFGAEFQAAADRMFTAAVSNDEYIHCCFP